MPEFTLGTITAAQILKVRHAVGVERGLKEADGFTPRDATVAEAQDWGRDLYRRLVQGMEMREAKEAAERAVVVSPLDFT